LEGLYTDGLCTAAAISMLLRQLMLKVSEGDIGLQLQQFLQFVPVIGSRELEGKAAKGGVRFGDDQRDIFAGARATGGC
jgi:hypothetical protein